MENNTNPLLSPDVQAGGASQKSGVRRVNNRPIYLIAIGAVLFLLMMGWVAKERIEQQEQKSQKSEEKSGDTKQSALAVIGKQPDGIIPPSIPIVLTATPAKNAVLLEGPDDLNTPPLPPSVAQRGLSNEELARIRITKMQQFEEAIQAKTNVEVEQMRSRGSSEPNEVSGQREETLARVAAIKQRINTGDPTTDYQSGLQGMQTTGLNKASAGPELIQKTASRRNDVGEFAGKGQADRWRLDAKPEAPRSPYELRAGFIIPATLISGINSDLPGQIMAQVSQNVYDTPTGKYKLIPQGSRLVGRYSNDVAYGQARLLVAWQRIVFPDGKAMDIEAMPGADSAGYAGFNDKVNNHYFRLFASAFLMSGVTAGVTLSQQPQQNTGGPYPAPNANSAMSQALGQQLGQVTAQLIAKNMNIAPTLEIRPGYRFNVIVIKDMTFSKPYQAFDY